MGHKVFSSYRTGKNKDADDTQTLIVEIAAKHIACLVKSENKQIRDFELFKFDKESLSFVEAYREVVGESSLLTQAYSTTRVFINNETCLLAPLTNLNQEAASNFLNVVHGGQVDNEILLDNISDENLSTVYSIPKEWSEELNRSLQIETFEHTYSSIIDQVLHKAAIDGSLLKVIFYDTHFIALLFTQKKLQFIQSFTYQTSEDILYHLLNIVQCFQLDTNSALLQVSGMVDVKSNVIDELKQYFKRVTLEEADTKSLQVNIGDYSRHYFTPFFNLAK
jgi:hypothetical protein